MRAFERAKSFSDELLRTVEWLEADSLTVRPGDPTSPVQVGGLSTPEMEGEVLRCLYVVSDFSNFAPMVFTNCEELAVSSSLLALLATVGSGPAPAVGTTYDLVGSDALQEKGIAGLVLLKASTLGVFAGWEDVIEVGGEVYELRLVVYLDAEEVAGSRRDFSALLDTFQETDRDIFLIR